MNEQLTSDELRQVLAEWIRPMYPKERQKIAGLFEAVIARAETAAVSYTHLDVYKRQELTPPKPKPAKSRSSG